MKRAKASNLVTADELSSIVSNVSSVLSSAALVELSALYQLEPIQAAALPAARISSTDAHKRPSEFLDSWLQRQALLKNYRELLTRVERDHSVGLASLVVEKTNDSWLRLMGRHQLIEYLRHADDEADLQYQLEIASREAYAVQAPAERVIAIADGALVEDRIGLHSRAEDSFLEASILGGTLVEATERLVANAKIGSLMVQASDLQGATSHFNYAQLAASNLKPGVAHDLGRMQLAENLATAGFTGKALAEIEKIDDPYIAVPASLAVASVFNLKDDQTSVRSAVVLAHRLGAGIVNPTHRDRLLAQVNATLNQ